MSDIAISVQNLSKRYRIGKPKAQTTKRRSITRRIASPFQYLYSTLRQPAPDEVIWALKDVSFEVKYGEVLGIIGRNGAGKTTLLKILSRITEPTSGRAILNGRVSSLLEVGTGFHPELTGRENIYLSGAILGMKKAEIDRKFDEIVDFSGVEKFIDTPVKRYSSGMRVRLAFSVAAHLEPEILLIDEVLAVGDAEFQKKCLGKMSEVAGEGRTVLFVSHNMPSIEALCGRAFLLDAGRIVYSDSAVYVIENYLKQNNFLVRAFTDLREHPGRSLNSRPIMNSIRLLNQKAEETANIRLGERVTFEIDIGMEGTTFRSPFIHIHILDNRETSICRFINSIMNHESVEVSGRCLVRCHWDKCMLAPGNYSINLQLKNSGLVLDQVINATSFEILPADVYGSGKLPGDVAKDYGVIIPEGKWEYEPIAINYHLGDM